MEHTFQHGISSLATELLGSAIIDVEGLNWLGQIWQHLTSLLLLGNSVIFGLRPIWRVIWIGLPLLPFVLIFIVSALGFSYKNLFARGEAYRSFIIFRSLAGCLLAGFIFSPYGADPSGRYFLPLSIPLACFASELLTEILRKSRLIAGGLTVLLLVYKLWGTLQSARRYPPGITTQFNAATQVYARYYGELITFLKAAGESRGYTNYWVSYPLAFLSEEELIFIPRLPYHLDFRYTPRDDRYPAYQDEVKQADRVAYITTHRPPSDQYLSAQFQELGISLKEKVIGDFNVFYNLSAIIYSEQIGSGEQYP